MTVVCVPLVNCRKKERILPFKLTRKCLHGLTGELTKIEIPVGVFPFWIGADGDAKKPGAGRRLVNSLIRQELLTIPSSRSNSGRLIFSPYSLRNMIYRMVFFASARFLVSDDLLTTAIKY